MFKFRYSSLFIYFFSMVLIFVALKDISFLVKDSHSLKDSKDVVAWLKKEIHYDDQVILSPLVDHPYILLASRKPLSQFITLECGDTGKLSEKHLQRLLGNREADYFLYSSEGYRFNGIAFFSEDKRRYEAYGVVFEEIYRSGRFRVFKILY